ncbi:MAG: type I-D CRISPR-associated endonuclease Cas1 [Chloroflexi bacterium]|uniref:CRISPR-associated endonuclease Cas1 n=1 Tax=Candidatus Chlorohelix allophototropha TaxID=3003348 RepID=A0A8T7M4N7_9CHLR|nr:type I-D CRISPR-associated endonuclease Cas1 [Chloroflexota bacterium]WJW70371.1 type I-D CRISPR-associated endonuclease Cas1d [Chloroflexota bacterium L227-S17]
MPTLYLTEDRALVRRDSEDCLLVQIPDRRGEGGVILSPARKERIPLIKVDGVVVMGEVTMTASALHLLLERNIEVNFLSHFGQFKGRLSPPLTKNSLLRLAQHRAHNDLAKRSELARRFVIGKLSNQRTLLQRYNRRQSDPAISQEVDLIATLLRKLATLAIDNPGEGAVLSNGDRAIANSSIETILGLEGAGSAAYFRCFGKLLTDPEQWPFGGRVKRPPTDPINAMLSFGYSLLTNQVASAVQSVGFDQYIGYLHSSVYGRPALALDLMEEFRPLIVDSVVLTLLNNRMLSMTDFTVELDAYRMKNEPRKIFLTKFEERLNEEITHPVFGYKVKYRRCIELQARLVAKFLTGEIPEYVPFTVR